MEKRLKNEEVLGTPSPIMIDDFDQPLSDDAENSDLRDFQSMPPMAKNFSEQVDDGLPTIMENSTQEQLQPIKSKTHLKKQSEQIDMSSFQNWMSTP